MTAMPKRHDCAVVRLGKTTEEIVPHFLPGVGARVFVIRENDLGIHIENVPPDALRAYADRLKIAACQAESMERRAASKEDARGYIRTTFFKAPARAAK